MKKHNDTTHPHNTPTSNDRPKSRYFDTNACHCGCNNCNECNKNCDTKKCSCGCESCHCNGNPEGHCCA